MPFAGNLRTLPLPDVFQTLNNITATGVLRLRAAAGSRDVVFNQGEIIGVGFLDKESREDLPLRLSLLGLEENAGERLKGVTWYWTAMQARARAGRGEIDELIHTQAREQLHNLFAWNNAEFSFEDAGPGRDAANELVSRCLERPLAIDTATILLEAARQQDEWAELRERIRNETGAAAMGSSPALTPHDPAADDADEDDDALHLYLDGEWRGPYPRQQVLGMVQTGEVPPEIWTYDPRDQQRRTCDQLFGADARRITPDELESLRQAVKAAEGRLAEERAGRAADLAELRGLAGEVLRLARDCRLDDPAIGAVIERLAESIDGGDPSLVALSAETLVVSLVRHLRQLADEAAAAGRRASDALADAEAAADAERHSLESLLAEAEERSESDRQAATVLRERLAAAAEDAARLGQEMERLRRDGSRSPTEQISAITPSGGDAQEARRQARDEAERELSRLRAEHARLLNEVSVLRTALDEQRFRHETELEASRAVASALGERPPPGEGAAREAALAAEVARLKSLLEQAEQRGGSGLRRAVEERNRLANERDEARGDTERLRRDLHQARAEAARAAERQQDLDQAARRIATAEERADRIEGEAAALRTQLEASEAERRRHEQSAYEAARQNTQLQVRLGELAARLAEGERRLAELGDISSQLAEARERSATLAEEGAQIRRALDEHRRESAERLERARRRIATLRQRLRAGHRGEQPAPVPWSSPITAGFAAAPTLAQAPVPWPSPATAAFSSDPPPEAQRPAETLRTTSGTFMPMPMPGSAAGGASPAARGLPEPGLRRRPLPRRLALALAAAAVLAAALWYGTATVPICDVGRVNGVTEGIAAPIAGQIAEAVPVGTWVEAGRPLARIRNGEIDRARLLLLEDRARLAAEKLASIDAALARVRSESALLQQALIERPPAPGPEADARLRLRDEVGQRLAELSASADDMRARRRELEDAVAAERQRLDSMREAVVLSPCEGLVHDGAQDGASVGGGRTIFSILRADRMVIEAEMPDSASVRRGDAAQVRVGASLLTATVESVDPPTELVRRLVHQSPPSAGARRILLAVDPSWRSALAARSDRSLRVALTGTAAGQADGLFSWLALTLRF